MRIRHVLLVSLALFAPASARAQVAADELLVNIKIPGHLRHVQPDGTLVASTTTYSVLTGVDILADGSWVTVRRSSGRSLMYFAPDGTLLRQVLVPEVDNYPAGDVAAFADGSVVVTSTTTGSIHLFDPAGAHVSAWGGFGAITPDGVLVDALGEVWIADAAAGKIWHLDANGNELAHITTGGQGAIDVDEAPDGTLWAIFYAAPRVRRYARDGALLGSFEPSQQSLECIAVASDGTAWVGNGINGVVRRFDTDGTQVGAVSVGGRPEFLAVPQALGGRYCAPIASNSAGTMATIDATGSRFVVDNDVTLSVQGMPPGQFGYFLVGSHTDVVIPPGSQGFLCIACTASPGCGAIGRFTQPGEILVGPSGAVALDLGSFPVPGSPAVVPGDTWNFQCWYRDGATSHTSDALQVAFR